MRGLTYLRCLSNCSSCFLDDITEIYHPAPASISSSLFSSAKWPRWPSNPISSNWQNPKISGVNNGFEEQDMNTQKWMVSPRGKSHRLKVLFRKVSPSSCVFCVSLAQEFPMQLNVRNLRRLFAFNWTHWSPCPELPRACYSSAN